MTNQISATSVLIDGRRLPFIGLAETSLLYRTTIERLGLGGSETPQCQILDGETVVAYVSYNGRVWEGEEYDPGASPLYCPSVVTGKIADRFRSVIQDWLGAERCTEIDEINRQRSDNSCATQDYCDANMAMDQAFRELGYDMDKELDEGFTDLMSFYWNDAWSFAKHKGFSRQA
ncbi:hypothetical protein [Roseibium album]|uniref:hypothetical protein n=1 Tax=Roseibium album TaxID=311410 RepID=UPI00391D56E1